MDRNALAAAFEALGVRRGHVLLVHSSLSRIGQVEGGANTVVDALLEAIGPEGTLVVPTIIHTSGLPRPPFEPATSPSEVGAITEGLRLRQGALRSDHPTHSVAAIGPKAAALTKGHAGATGPWTPWGRQAFGEGSPWDLLFQWDAQYLLLGVSFQVCTLFHYAQTQYLRRHQPAYAGAIPFPYFSHEAMGAILEAKIEVKIGNAGAAECRLATARATVSATLAAMEECPDRLFTGENARDFADWRARRPASPMPLLAGLASVEMRLDGTAITSDGTGLNVRLLAIRDGERAAMLASLPLAFLRTDQAIVLRRRLSESTGIPFGHIMLACTHVHSGLPHSRTDAMLEDIGSALVEAARLACDRLQPVRLGVHRRPLPGLSRVRRVLMNDGQAYTVRRAVPSTWRPEAKDEFVGPESELDDELIVVRIEDATRRPIGCLFHFTTHPIPDLHGYAADELERQAGVVCLPLNGALGDVDTIFERALAGRFESAQLPCLGGALAGAVLESLARAEVKDGGALEVAGSPLALAVDPLICENRRHDAIPWIAKAAAAGVFELEMMALRVGPISLVGIPGELACGLGEFLKRSGDQVRLPVGLANGFAGYLLSREAIRRGGYEADVTFWRLTAPGSAESIVMEAERLLNFMA